MTGGEGEMLRCFGLGLAVAGKAYIWDLAASL